MEMLVFSRSMDPFVYMVVIRKTTPRLVVLLLQRQQ
jgi:hypothetical protein